MPANTRDKKNLSKLCYDLKRRSMTVEEISNKYSISIRTVYRWLDYLTDEEIELISTRIGKDEAKWRVAKS